MASRTKLFSSVWRPTLVVITASLVSLIIPNVKGSVAAMGDTYGKIIEGGDDDNDRGRE